MGSHREWIHPGGLLSARKELEKLVLARQFIEARVPTRFAEAVRHQNPFGLSHPAAPQKEVRFAPDPQSALVPFQPNPTAAHAPGYSESDKIRMRIGIIKDMIRHKDHTSLASLHDAKLDTCYLHQDQLNNHRLVECHKFLTLARGSGDLLKDMKRKITTGNQKPHGSALRAQSEGGTKNYSPASALAAAEAFDEEVANSSNKLDHDESYLRSPNSSSPSHSNSLPLGHFNISHAKTAVSDTGATDHMSGVRALFSVIFSFPSKERPMISLGDDSVIPAEGWGLLDYTEN